MEEGGEGDAMQTLDNNECTHGDTESGPRSDQAVRVGESGMTDVVGWGH